MYDYPKFRRDESVKEDFHGQIVIDHYRYLEDPDSEETKQFVDAQNAISRPFLNGCQDKSAINRRLTELWDYPKYSAPSLKGSRYFYWYNSGLQNQSVLFVQDSLSAEPRELFDPNKLSQDGTIAIRSHSCSENGQLWAYGLSEGGSDWFYIKIREVETGKDLDDRVDYAKFSSISWTHDNAGFFYARFPPSATRSDGTETDENINHKVYYHRIGTAQSEDKIVFEMPQHSKWTLGCEVSDDGRYVILYANETCDPVNLLFVADLTAEDNKLLDRPLKYQEIVSEYFAEFGYVTNDDQVMLVRTNLEAPNYRLIQIDLNNDKREQWQEFLAQDERDVLDYVQPVNKNQLLVNYMRDAHDCLYLHDLKTGQRLLDFELPLGTIGISARRENNEFFYKFVSFLTPGDIYRVDLTVSPPKPVLFRKISLKGIDAAKYVTKQQFYSSKDGTQVPMFICHRKDITNDGSNPCLLYGYGGFNISLQPTFSLTNLFWMEHYRGVFAMPNLRGGGEYGMKWYDGGRLANKQNVFDDFIAAAEYLIGTGLTRADRLCIEGGSNGGTLVAVCANQRPDLFATIICQVGVLDMLRFHKFTIGHHWVSDFGSPDKSEEFQWIWAYSPLHRIGDTAEKLAKSTENDTGPKQYPNILLLTADHDDRVVPLHSLKFIAELQHQIGHRPEQRNPLMIRVEQKAGHGAGKPTAKKIEELTDTFSFMARTLGLSYQNCL